MAHSNIKFCISGEMNGTVAALSAEGSLLRREGQPGDVTGPQGLGGWVGGVRDPSLSLTLMALTTLKVSGHFSCQYPSLQAEEPSRLGAGQAPLAGISQKGCCAHGFDSSHHFERLG